MVIRSLVIGVATALLAGCVTVGPDYATPQTAPVTLQQAGAVDYVADHPVATWWSQFDDPVLDQLVREALLANHDVRIAVSRVNEARAVFSERRLDLAPHVTMGVEGTRTKQPVEGQGRVETDARPDARASACVACGNSVKVSACVDSRCRLA